MRLATNAQDHQATGAFLLSVAFQMERTDDDIVANVRQYVVTHRYRTQTQLQGLPFAIECS